MKTLFFLSWLAFGGAAYYAYAFYNDTVAKQTMADQAAASDLAKIGDLQVQVHQLTAKFADLTAQFQEKTRENVELRGRLGLSQTSAAVNFVDPVSTTASTMPATSTPIAFPTTITTISGKTYQECKFDKSTPDGISFFHSTGVAHIPFTDLDPDFAASFGYNAKTSADYLKQEAAKEQQSDAQRDAFDAAAATASSTVNSQPSSIPQDPRSNGSKQAKIATFQSQISSLISQAQAIDAQDEAAFNSAPNIYYNQSGQIEHNHTMIHSPQAAADRAQAQALQVQIIQLQNTP